MSIDAAQLEAVHRLVWNTEGGSDSESEAPPDRQHFVRGTEAFSVTLRPMQIRTWRCFYQLV